MPPKGPETSLQSVLIGGKIQKVGNFLGARHPPWGRNRRLQRSCCRFWRKLNVSIFSANQQMLLFISWFVVFARDCGCSCACDFTFWLCYGFGCDLWLYFFIFVVIFCFLLFFVAFCCGLFCFVFSFIIVMCCCRCLFVFLLLLSCVCCVVFVAYLLRSRCGNNDCYPTIIALLLPSVKLHIATTDLFLHLSRVMYVPACMPASATSLSRFIYFCCNVTALLLLLLTRYCVDTLSSFATSLPVLWWDCFVVLLLSCFCYLVSVMFCLLLPRSYAFFFTVSLLRVLFFAVSPHCCVFVFATSLVVALFSTFHSVTQSFALTHT